MVRITALFAMTGKQCMGATFAELLGRGVVTLDHVTKYGIQ
jgi:hypothetical protein